MKNLFNVDGPVMTFLVRVADMIILSILWGICCIPIITIGPATTALYYVTLKMVSNEEDGVIKCFFRSFKLNFRQGVLLTLFFLVAYVALYFSYRIISSIEGVFGTVLSVLCLILTICILGATLYSFPILAKFYNTTGRTLKNAVMLAFQNIFSTILFTFLNVCPVILCLISTELLSLVLPLCFLLTPAVVAYLCSMRLSKIFDAQIQST